MGTLRNLPAYPTCTLIFGPCHDVSCWLSKTEAPSDHWPLGQHSGLSACQKWKKHTQCFREVPNEESRFCRENFVPVSVSLPKKLLMWHLLAELLQPGQAEGVCSCWAF